MRKRISEKNIFPQFSIEIEYKKLHELFCNRNAFGLLTGPLNNNHARPSMSYNDCLEGMFLDWKLRGTFISVEEMLLSLQISESDFARSVTEERVLDYIQFVINAVLYVEKKVKAREYNIYQDGMTVYNAIMENSKNILDELGADIIKERNELYIVYKDNVADAVIAEKSNLKRPITEYLKINNRGDLQRKGEVLCSLAKELEAYEKKLNGTEFKQLCTDTTFLLNNIGARHYQNPDNKMNAAFLNMTDEELEKWYDKTFQMILACMTVIPYLEIKTEIKTIKSL